jgi:hypothetical protein
MLKTAATKVVPCGVTEQRRAPEDAATCLDACSTNARRRGRFVR